MGIWFLGSSLGNILAGLLAGKSAGDAAAQMPHVFMQVVYLAGATGVVLLVLATAEPVDEGRAMSARSCAGTSLSSRS